MNTQTHVTSPANRKLNFGDYNLFRTHWKDDKLLPRRKFLGQNLPKSCHLSIIIGNNNDKKITLGVVKRASAVARRPSPQIRCQTLIYNGGRQKFI
jgi:hypothetical protein